MDKVYSHDLEALWDPDRYPTPAAYGRAIISLELRRWGSLLLAAAALVLFLFSVSPAWAQSAKTSTTPAIQVGLSAVATVSTLSLLDGHLDALALRAGFGAHADLLGGKLRLGLYVAPAQVSTDRPYLDLHVLPLVGYLLPVSFAALHVGGGVGWDAVAAGGPDAGLHDLHRRHLYLYWSLGAGVF